MAAQMKLSFPPISRILLKLCLFAHILLVSLAYLGFAPGVVSFFKNCIFSIPGNIFWITFVLFRVSTSTSTWSSLACSSCPSSCRPTPRPCTWPSPPTWSAPTSWSWSSTSWPRSPSWTLSGEYRPWRGRHRRVLPVPHRLRHLVQLLRCGRKPCSSVLLQLHSLQVGTLTELK